MKHPYTVILIIPADSDHPEPADRVYSVEVDRRGVEGLPRTAAEAIATAQQFEAKDSHHAPEDFVATHVYFRNHCVWERSLP